jgi:hypothetical protein
MIILITPGLARRTRRVKRVVEAGSPAAQAALDASLGAPLLTHHAPLLPRPGGLAGRTPQDSTPTAPGGLTGVSGRLGPIATPQTSGTSVDRRLPPAPRLYVPLGACRCRIALPQERE